MGQKQQPNQEAIIFGNSKHAIRLINYLRPLYDVYQGFNYYKVLKCHVTMMDCIVPHLLELRHLC